MMFKIIWLMNHSNQSSVLVHWSLRHTGMRLLIIFTITLVMNHSKNPIPICFSSETKGFQRGYMCREWTRNEWFKLRLYSNKWSTLKQEFSSTNENDDDMVSRWGEQRSFSNILLTWKLWFESCYTIYYNMISELFWVSTFCSNIWFSL